MSHSPDRASAPDIPPGERVAERGGQQAGGVILVVEDNPVNMRLMRLTLSTRGYTVYGATCGEQALTWLAGRHADVILLDMQLPGMDGFSVAARIKSRVEWERIPIIAVTSYAMTGDQERALAAGCDAYVSKPIDDAVLLTTIRAVCCRPWPQAIDPTAT